MKGIDLCDHLRVHFLPVKIIFLSVRAENDLHGSTNSGSFFPIESPRSRLSMDSIKRFAFVGLMRLATSLSCRRAKRS